MKDKIIKCQDCAQDFAFTPGEQEFYQQKGLKGPVRCPICRSAHQAAAKDQFRGKSNIKKK